MRVLIATLMLMLVGLAGMGQETKTPHNTKIPSGKEFAERVLSAKDYQGVIDFLTSVNPEWGCHSWALPPILDDIGQGKATDAHWEALVRLDSWGDGAWWAEFEGACYDAVTKYPEQFMREYLKGEDRALWIIQSAMKYPIDMLQIGEGGEREQHDIQEYNQAMLKLKKTVQKITSNRDNEEREKLLFDEVTKQCDFWPKDRDLYLKWQAEQEKDDKQQVPTPRGE